MRPALAAEAALRQASAARRLHAQRRAYYPYGETLPRPAADPPADAGAPRAAGVAELLRLIEGPLQECEDIMSTWRETKWHGREASEDLRAACDDFIARRYDRGEEVGVLERVMLMYRLMNNRRFDGAFNGYFRKTPDGRTVLDQVDRWGQLRQLLADNMPVLADLHAFLGYSEEGYRGALGRMFAASLQHRLPTGRGPNWHDKVIFQHRDDGSEMMHIFADYQDDESIDYFFLHPHPRAPGWHRLTLLCIGSRNKYKRRAQLPDGHRKRLMGRRCEKVFGLPADTVHTHVLFTPPTCLTRQSLLECHVAVGGLHPDYAQWLPYYPESEAERALDVDWHEQARKAREDEWHQL
eukprot:TRINITY_DN20870_c0_g2_i1.p1 TRINITY_DN20870_c0_g2~~TRINITY_DN20870_c0_g2_i1.p1  ORF type:complete len:377 (+),score=110.95 TRINITY_DN20870_c0_g2_i1:75-1133(+)